MKIEFKNIVLLLILLGIYMHELKAQSIPADTIKNKVSEKSQREFPIPSFKNMVIGKSIRLTVGGQLREYYQFYNNEK